MNEVINEDLIFEFLEKGKKARDGEILRIIEKAQFGNGLHPEEVAALLHIEGPFLLEKIFSAAREVKLKIYGKRLVLFAPLYLSNFCENNCHYCGFRRDNHLIKRKTLSMNEIRKQVIELENLGHKRLLLECGESSHSDIEYVVEAIKTIYSTRSGKGEIRRVNVNIAATTVDNYRKLKAAKIGTYQLFQETYHRETYEKIHSGPKADYDRQIMAMDRAQEAGIDDVGLGVLFGLYDYKFEVMSLIFHAKHLDSKYGVGPHTISFPRWREAEGINFRPQYPVGDEDLKKVIAIIRLAIPYTGMIITTREKPQFRAEAWQLGISQTSAGSRTSPGGYGKGKNEMAAEQFTIYDLRPTDEVIRGICELGYLPSFCTACYRTGRTGKTFMGLAKPGDIHFLCQPNAILTFKEYLIDYATPETRLVGENTINELLNEIEEDQRRKETEKRLIMIEKGTRDIYF